MFTLGSKIADIMDWFVDESMGINSNAHSECSGRAQIYLRDDQFGYGSQDSTVSQWIEIAFIYKDDDDYPFRWIAYALMLPYVKEQMDEEMQYRLAEVAAQRSTSAIVLLSTFSGSLPAEIELSARASLSFEYKEIYRPSMEPYRREF